MNKFKVTINAIDYTSHTIYPLKWGELLDERLDEAYFTLKFIDKAEPFQPLDKVSISINDGTKIVNYYVANDKVDNNPVGSNLYTHTLYVIEETKFLEAFICDTLTFRNALLNRFGENYDAVVTVDKDSAVAFVKTQQNGDLNYYKNPLPTDELLVLKSIVEAAAPICTYHNEHAQPPVTDSQVVAESDRPGAEFPKSKIEITYSDGRTTQTIEDINAVQSIKLSSVTTIKYYVLIGSDFRDPVSPTDPGIPFGVISGIFSYTLNGVENRLPLKKWTITDVVNRCLELAEPLREGENPRFNFDGVSYKNGEIQKYTIGSQAEKYDKIIAPEFSMTKNTLREQLKQIGGFIHAEPRLNGNTVSFVEWGGNEQSKISEKQFISQSQTHSIDEYCTELDSTANNLVNRLNYAQGVIMEPSRSGSRSLRTEQINIRIEEANGIIETVLPIADLVKLEVSAPTNETGTEYSNFVDITSYTYEQGDYSNLSSYDVNVKGSKAYALYWARNQKNIKGLFFKNENALNPIFSKYAIVNILVACSVNMNTGTGNSNYPRLRFRVSYIPVYTARVRANKSLIVETVPRTLAYNQGANSVETQFYGENLKGVVARLGNVEKTLTYKLASIDDIPKAGHLYDEHYYISSVACELYPDYIKCTIGLSKDFNRLSEYIGISSEYRQYQVSETAVYNRETVVQEYALITDKTTEVTDSENDLFLAADGIDAICSDFNNVRVKGGITGAQVVTQKKNGDSLLKAGESLWLPCTSSSFGNTMSFRFAFEDNYSAGQSSKEQTDNKGNKTFYSEYVPYTDYYGKFYWLKFSFMERPYLSGAETSGTNKFPFSVPLMTQEPSSATYRFISGKIRYRKDNAEIPALNYQLSYVTDSHDYIIGSAIASDSALVVSDYWRNLSDNIHVNVYGFRTKRIPLFADTIDVTDSDCVLLGTSSALNENRSITLKLNTSADAWENGGLKQDIVAWAIVTPSDSYSETVEDESGNETQQTTQRGNRLMLGCNRSYNAGQTITFPRIVFKHKIYK